jgi:uncharacterized membrane protein HdeD (DUF308 family)
MIEVIAYSILAGIVHSISGYLKNNSVETFDAKKLVSTILRALIYGALVFGLNLNIGVAESLIAIIGIDTLVLNLWKWFKLRK